MAKRNAVHQIRRATQKRYSSEEKIRIVLEGLRGEIPDRPGHQAYPCSNHSLRFVLRSTWGASHHPPRVDGAHHIESPDRRPRSGLFP
jgi:hypothetical protein